MADSNDKGVPQGDATDEQINAWWAEERKGGSTDKKIQRDLIEIMAESYREILLQLDAAQLEQFKNEGFPHWGGAYRPMFPETGHGSDGSGAMKISSMRTELEWQAHLEMTEPAKRMRALYRIYERHATGAADRADMLTLALIGEWMPVVAVKMASRPPSGGQRTAPGAAQGRTPGAIGTEETLPPPSSTGTTKKPPAMRVNLMPKGGQQGQPAAGATTSNLPTVGEVFREGPPHGDQYHFLGSVQAQGRQVTYIVESQITKINDVPGPAAMAKRNEALGFAARIARERGQPMFTMKVKQANPDSVTASAKLIEEVGVGKGTQKPPVPPAKYGDYEGTLDTARVLKKLGAE